MDRSPVLWKAAALCGSDPAPGTRTEISPFPDSETFSLHENSWLFESLSLTHEITWVRYIF